MPGQRISNTDCENINPKFICTVCALLLIAPMQTPCGHLMCYVCLQDLLRCRCPTCASDGTHLRKEDVFPDAFTRREIMGLHLHCPNDDCEWSGTYKDLLKHDDECSEAPLSSTVTGIRRREMNQHVEEIPWCWTIIYMIIRVLLMLKIFLDSKRLRQFISSLSTDAMSFCGKVLAMVKMFMGLEQRVVNLEERTGGAGNGSGMAAKLKTMEAMILKIRRKYDDVVHRNQRLENESHAKDFQIAELEERVDHAELALAENTAKLRHMEAPSQGHSMISYNGTLLWRIVDFQQKRREAVSGTQTAIYSPPFYTSQFGYKMCARVYLNGDGFGKDTHISLLFVVAKGEYDALLPWPFQKKITMMLLDQNNGDHMIDSFRADAESSLFQRPTNNMNIASGSPLFMPLDGLSNRAYIKDDTMFIKIIVD